MLFRFQSSMARQMTKHHVCSCFLLQVLEVQKANFSAAIVHNSPNENYLVQMAGGECECTGCRVVCVDLHESMYNFCTNLSPVRFLSQCRRQQQLLLLAHLSKFCLCSCCLKGCYSWTYLAKCFEHLIAVCAMPI